MWAFGRAAPAPYWQRTQILFERGIWGISRGIKKGECYLSPLEDALQKIRLSDVIPDDKHTAAGAHVMREDPRQTTHGQAGGYDRRGGGGNLVESEPATLYHSILVACDRSYTSVIMASYDLLNAAM